jgi:hypothetical protein
MNEGQSAYTMYIGIDVAAATVSVAMMSPGQLMRPVFTIEQTEPAYPQNKLWRGRIPPLEQPRLQIVTSAQGIYSRCAVKEKRGAGSRRVRNVWRIL